MNPKGILFDLDGVIIDSESAYSDFWNSIERDFPTGIPNFAAAIKGMTLPKIFQFYPDAKVRDEIMRRIEELEETFKYYIFPGVTRFLRELRNKGVKTAIVTSSSAEKMKSLYEQLPDLTKYFDAVIDGSMVKHGKPHPEPYLTGAETLGLKPEDCVVFEDSYQGMESGKEAGCKVVGVCTTFPEDKVSELTPYTINSFENMNVKNLDKMLS